MEIAIVTGSLGLVGAESVLFLSACGLKVVGIDNDMRREFFSDDASTKWNRKILEEILSGRLRAIKIGRQYRISSSNFSLYMDLNAVS